MSIHIINISIENWPSCDKDKIFGIPVTEKSWPRLRNGDLVLVKWALTKAKPCGCIAIWEFERDQEVPHDKRIGPNEIIPWSDNAYRLKQYSDSWRDLGNHSTRDLEDEASIRKS